MGALGQTETRHPGSHSVSLRQPPGAEDSGARARVRELPARVRQHGARTMDRSFEFTRTSHSRIVIGDVKNSTYYATVYLENNGVERTVDARPSDAISLALRTRAPLYVTEDVLARRNTANLESWLAKQDLKISSKQQEVREP